jgi:hypothetical protein
MLPDLPVQYGVVFLLGIIMYTPVVLFSTGKYKSGLKCAAATCLWMLMVAASARVVALLYPTSPIPQSSATVGTAESANSEPPCTAESVQKTNHRKGNKVLRRNISMKMPDAGTQQRLQ